MTTKPNGERAMNAKETKRKIRAARQRAAELEAWITELEDYRRELLKRMPEPGAGGREAERRRSALETVDHGWDGSPLMVGGSVQDGFQRRLPGLVAARSELATLRETVELLEEELPGEAETARAERDLAALLEKAGDLETSARIEASRLLDHLSDAAEAARELAEASAERRMRVSQAHELAEQWGLDAILPARRREPAMSPAQERLALALRDLIAQVVAGDAPEVATLGQIEDAQKALRGRAAA